MNLKDYYWYFSEQVPHKFCDDVITLAKSKQEILGSIDTVSETDVTNNKNIQKQVFEKRKSNIVWLNEQWVYDMIVPFVHSANQNAGWNFHWDWCETAQFTIYKEGQYYGWHSDDFPTPYPKEKGVNFEGKTRKLSITVALNDGSEYEGGELQIDPRNYNPEKRKDSHIMKCEQVLKKGSVAVFPSHVWHRVTPVTKGTRYSLVMWCIGKPFI